MNRNNLIPLPTTPREDRLWKRCEILCKNFHDPEYGVDLMIDVVKGMFEVFATNEADWLEQQILAKLYETEFYLYQYKVQNEQGLHED